jgi:Holliday junction resolvase
MTRSKGDRNERNLVIALEDNAFSCMRGPSSGSATTRELPDVLAGSGNEDLLLAIEAKSSSGDPIYIQAEKVGHLVEFAHGAGAIALLASRFNAGNSPDDPLNGTDEIGKWRFHRPADLYRTDSGNYRIKRETALDRGLTLEQIKAGVLGIEKEPASTVEANL